MGIAMTKGWQVGVGSGGRARGGGKQIFQSGNNICFCMCALFSTVTFFFLLGYCMYAMNVGVGAYVFSYRDCEPNYFSLFTHCVHPK